MFNVLILRSTDYRFGYHSSIHLWVTEENLVNAPLMLLLAYIIVGHREWRHAEIRLFACCNSGDGGRETQKLSSLMTEGRLPISKHNVTRFIVRLVNPSKRYPSDHLRPIWSLTDDDIKLARRSRRSSATMGPTCCSSTRASRSNRVMSLAPPSSFCNLRPKRRSTDPWQSKGARREGRVYSASPKTARRSASFSRVCQPGPLLRK